MTTTVKRGAGRPAAAAKTTKAAQRTPLPASEQETPAEEFNRLTALPLSQQTKAIQKRIRQLSNLPENTGPREEAEETPLSQQTAAQLRETARKLGLSPSAKMTKDKLIGLIYAKTTPATPVEEAAASEAPAETSTEAGTAAPAKPSRKRRFSAEDLAMEENGHSDQGHDSILSGEYTGTEEVRAMMERCPICRPEIVANTAHSGSSRAGMVINVPLRADGRTKAATVAEKLGALKIEATVKRSKGAEILTAKIGEADLKLVWDAQGRYVYAESTFNSRKVRNVSEALRLAAQKADAGQ